MALIQQTNPAILARYFIGFSTMNSATTGIRTLYDIDLINVDLTTAFNTRVGERVMRPDYGCALWDYLMEPMTTVMAEMVITEATRIVNLDSRCVVLQVQPLVLDHGFRIECTLNYLPWNVTGVFTTDFIASDLTYFSGDGS